MPTDARAVADVQEELHAAVLCLGAAKRTGYESKKLKEHFVRRARARVTKAEDAYYTILMRSRG